MSDYAGFRHAVAGDLPWIAALEELPENHFVSGETLTAHREHFKDDTFCYLIAQDSAGERIGYAQLVNDGPDRIEWRRIVIDSKGSGRGQAFMRDVIRHFRENTAKQVMWLDVFTDNNRARHIYGKLGFKETGETPSPSQPGKMLVVMEMMFERSS